MKKIMVMAAVALAAIGVNAAAISWSAFQVQASPAGAFVGGTTTYKAYIFAYTGASAASDAAAGLTAMTALLDNGTSTDLAAFEAAALGSKTATATSAATPAMNIGATPVHGDFAAGTDVAAFVIIVDAATISDAKNYIVAKKSGEAILTATAQTSNINFGYGSVAGVTNWSTVAAPEPTSGLMLLLGVGLMALKRKRA